VKLFGSPSRRHDRTSLAVADVSTVDTLPPDPAHGPTWRKAGADGRCAAGGECAGYETTAIGSARSCRAAFRDIARSRNRLARTGAGESAPDFPEAVRSFEESKPNFWGPIHRLRRDGGALHRRLGGVRHWAMPYSSQGGKGCQAVAVRPFTMDAMTCCSTCAGARCRRPGREALDDPKAHSAAN
jgi:hypothetical protein